VAGFLLAVTLGLGLFAAGCLEGDLRYAWGVPILPRAEIPRYPYFEVFVNFLVWISVVWGVVNLLPIFPLDGGQVSEELFTATQPHRGMRQSIVLSIVTAAVVAGYELLQVLKGDSPGALFTVFLFGYLAYLNYMRLQMHGGGPRW
jgi:Zn-dependent protease